MATLYHLPKKKGALKKHSKNLSFFRGNFWGLSQWRLHWGCRELSFVLDLSDQMCTLVLQGLAWYNCLFVYLCLMGCSIIFWCMIICCLFCLLKSFPNFHSVCHLNNNVCTPFQQFCGGSNHGSLVFIRFGYPVANSPIHSLKSLDHFLLTIRDKPCRSNQCNVHYITS